MKKFYNDPSMNISLFEEENVITASGDEKIAQTDAENFIKNELGADAVILTF